MDENIKDKNLAKVFSAILNTKIKTDTVKAASYSSVMLAGWVKLHEDDPGKSGKPLEAIAIFPAVFAKLQCFVGYIFRCQPKMKPTSLLDAFGY